MQVVHKQQLVVPQKVSYLYASKGNKKRKDKIPCPACKQVGCYQHCNNCGKSIRWKRDEMNRLWIYLDGTDIVHYNPETRKGCMNSGTKDGKYKDVNLKREQQGFSPFSTGNFYNMYVVIGRQNNVIKQEKINRYNKLTGYGYVENSKQKDLSYVKQWESFIWQE